MTGKTLYAGLFLWAITIAHVFYAPYTKVEESWTLHAVHDILKYGISKHAISHYDHIPHPGPVPRSFLGPLFLSAMSYIPNKLFNALLATFYGQNLASQIIVRCTLGSINAFALVYLAWIICQRQDRSVLLVLSALQFHVPFWTSRTVPNMLAFGPVQISLAIMSGTSSQRRLHFSIFMLASTAAILRSEVVAILVPALVGLLFQGRLRFKALALSASATVLLISLSIIIDSYFWQRWTWPEMEAFVFNVVHGGSSAWGTEPWHAYFSKHLPKLLLLVYPCAVLSVISNPRKNWLGLVGFGSIAILSLLKHKEWRFIVYVLPVLNATGISGVRALCRNRLLRRLVLLALMASALCVTAFSTYISHLNYPGGEAMSRFADLAVHSETPVSVHVDVLAATTGASLFTHSYECTECTYNRSETLSPKDLAVFDYLITETTDVYKDSHPQKEAVSAYAGIGRINVLAPLIKRHIPIPFVKTQPTIFILTKREQNNVD